MSFPPTDLYSAIGLLIVNFGTLEYLTLEYLQAQLSAGEYEKASKRHFNERLELCFNRISTNMANAETLEKSEEMRRRLKPVRELRNHIAHGYLLVRIDLESRKPLLSLSNPREFDVAYSAESLHLTLDQLLLLLNELGEVIKSFQGLAGYTTTTEQISL